MNGSLKAKNVLVGYINSGTFVKKCQSDWNEQDTDSLAYIQNKPTIITQEQLNAKQDKLTAQQLANLNEDHSKYLTAHQDISGKQDKLTAGSNITIENNVISATGGGGVGTVKSVNNAEPDANGNVKIDVSLLGVNVTPSLTDKYDLYYIDEEAEGLEVATQADIDRLDGDIANRVEKQQSVTDSGKYLKIGEDGVVIPATVSGGVDVQINGTSIVQDGVANIPLASDKQTPGLLNGYSLNYGIAINRTGQPYIYGANNPNIDTRKNYVPITPANLDYAVKCALCDGKGAAYTDEEKASARSRLGVGDWVEICDITMEEETNSIAIEFPAKKINQIIIRAIVPAVVAASQTSVSLFYDSGHVNIGYAASAFLSTSATRHNLWNITIANGISHSFVSYGSNNQASTNHNTSYNIGEKIGNNIDYYKIGYDRAGNNVFPIGTQLTIWTR